MNEQKPLLTITPEQAGIPSDKILRMIQRLEEKQLCMHSILVMRKGKIAAEGYWKPFSKERKHRMYSTTKSFVSVAVGLMADEGYFSLDDQVVKFFAEKLPPQGVHPYIQAMTIRDLLMMASAHERTTYRRMQDDDWVRTFFVYPPSHLPGKIFSYDTSATTVLTALVEKLSGMSLLDYMRPRLLDQIGFSQDAWCVKTPMGESWGGSGLLCTTRDLAKFALVCMNKGRYEGLQLIPEDYINAATSWQIDNTVANGHIESQQGYGYQFWRCRNNGFSCRGMGSQLAICLPDEDFVLVTTADTQSIPNGDFEIFDALWEELYPYLSKKPLQEDTKAFARLNRKLDSLTVHTAPGKSFSPVAALVSGKTYIMAENDMGIEMMRFEFESDKAVMHYRNRQGEHILSFGFGYNEIQRFPVYDYECIASAGWVEEHSLLLYCYLIDSHLATLKISVRFDDNTVTILMRKAAEGFMEEYNGFASGAAKNS